jgi:hypothetical protein
VRIAPSYNAASNFQIGVLRGRRSPWPRSRDPVNVLRRARREETLALQDDTIFRDRRRWPETGVVYNATIIRQWSSIMWTRDQFFSYSFLLAVTVAGVGLLTTLAFG